MRFLCHSTAFLYNVYIATVQMLKLQYDDVHCRDTKSLHTTKITVKSMTIVNT